MWGAGRELISCCCPVEGPPHFPDWLEEEYEGVGYGFASDLALPSSWALPLFGHSAAKWLFSPKLKQFLRLEYRSSRGDQSLGFSLESLGDLTSRGRRSDLFLSLRCTSLRFSSASREREWNQDDAEDLLRTCGYAFLGLKSLGVLLVCHLVGRLGVHHVAILGVHLDVHLG